MKINCDEFLIFFFFKQNDNSKIFPKRNSKKQPKRLKILNNVQPIMNYWNYMVIINRQPLVIVIQKDQDYLIQKVDINGMNGINWKVCLSFVWFFFITVFIHKKKMSGMSKEQASAKYIEIVEKLMAKYRWSNWFERIIRIPGGGIRMSKKTFQEKI